MTDKKVETVRLPMVCIHDRKDEEKGAAVARADALRAEVYELLDKNFTVTDTNFLTCIVYALNFNYNAEIAGVHSDMWHRVIVEEWVSRTDAVRVTCECDRVEDGLCAIYKWFTENREIDE